MKKQVFLILMMLAVSGGMMSAEPRQLVAEISGVNIEYEFMERITALAINSDGGCKNVSYRLYRIAGSDTQIYLELNGLYYRVRKNKKDTYKNIDVREYKYTCYIDGWMYFFNY